MPFPVPILCSPAAPVQLLAGRMWLGPIPYAGMDWLQSPTPRVMVSSQLVNVGVVDFCLLPVQLQGRSRSFIQYMSLGRRMGVILRDGVDHWAVEELPSVGVAV